MIQIRILCQSVKSPGQLLSHVGRFCGFVMQIFGQSHLPGGDFNYDGRK